MNARSSFAFNRPASVGVHCFHVAKGPAGGYWFSLPFLEAMAEQQKEQPKAASKSFRELTQGLAASEGAWRLSVVLGFLGLVAWLVVVLYLIGTAIGFSNFGYAIWSGESRGTLLLCAIALSGIVAFLIPWGIVQVVSWVIEGFVRTKDPKHHWNTALIGACAGALAALTFAIATHATRWAYFYAADVEKEGWPPLWLWAGIAVAVLTAGILERR